tara:strand:- start:2943 stop:3752 length:810 start_codon:yes stop_codon:yes gene_type:complete
MKKKLSLIWFIYKYGIEKYFSKNFKMYSPSVAGDSSLKGKHTVETINLIFPFISKLLLKLNIKSKIINSNIFSVGKKRAEFSSKIKKLFDFYGSDKAKHHDYHLIYSSIFLNNSKVKKILEIGMGTNDENLLSNMGINGKPGASLRAFRDFFKNAKIYGADIDKNILFKDHRIKTSYVDQTSEASLRKLFKKFGKNFDLIIDDGIHSPLANLKVILSSIEYLKKGGCLVIEDINQNSIFIWKVISSIIGIKHKNILIKCKKAYIFIIYK